MANTWEKPLKTHGWLLSVVLNPTRSRKKFFMEWTQKVFYKNARVPLLLLFPSRTQTTSQRWHLFFTLWKLKSVPEKDKEIVSVRRWFFCCFFFFFFFPVTYQEAEGRKNTANGGQIISWSYRTHSRASYIWGYIFKNISKIETVVSKTTVITREEFTWSSMRLDFKLFQTHQVYMKRKL